MIGYNDLWPSFGSEISDRSLDAEGPAEPIESDDRGSYVGRLYPRTNEQPGFAAEYVGRSVLVAESGLPLKPD